MRADDVDHALNLVHASEFGLSSNVWTRDLVLARRFARRVQAGGVFINGVSASDPRLPVGGVKKSGFGRELSEAGIREFVNTQTVWIGPALSETEPERTVAATTF
jgi:succinate-semialdehyde dehydrogenase